MSILGNRVTRVEDPRFLRGEGRFLENMPLEGALAVTFVRSPYAHARVAAIDASAAEALPGVRVFTGADVDVGPMAPPPHWHIQTGMERTPVARDIVRFVGEIVAIVVSEDRAAGADAVELVMVDYEPLPVVVAAEEAAKDEVLLFPEVGTNVANRGGSAEHDDGLFADCEVVVSGAVVSQRMAACPLEPRSAAAEVSPDGRITAWLTTQTPHTDKFVLSLALGVDLGQVRVVSQDVGGGFGVRCSAPRTSSSRGSRVGSKGRCAGRRLGRRAWRRCSRGADSGSSSRWAALARGKCWRTGSRSSATEVHTRRSAPSSRTSPG